MEMSLPQAIAIFFFGVVAGVSIAHIIFLRMRRD
jgi:hypothetical protein